MAEPNTLKRCPFCAEEIQAAAIVCRFCGRELAAGKAAATKKPVSAAKILIVLGVLAGAVGLFFVYAWSTSVYSVDLAASRSIVDDFTRKGYIISHECNPNQTVMKPSIWRTLPNNEAREHLMNALARLCISQGAGPRMSVFDEQAKLLAEFDGRSIVR